GYNVNYGASAASLTQVQNVGNTAKVSGLTPGVTYYFAVSAYNAAGVSSAYSNIVSYTATASPTPSPTPTPTPASSVTLAWNANPVTGDPATNPAGYILFIYRTFQRKLYPNQGCWKRGYSYGFESDKQSDLLLRYHGPQRRRRTKPAL